MRWSGKGRGGKAACRCSQLPDGCFFLTQTITYKTSLVRTFDGILLPDFCCMEATFSFAVTSPASDRWHSGSQEELGEHIHLRPNSSGTSSISLSPPATTLLPFNLCSLSRILHTLSWFCCSPRSVSFLPLWWNIYPFSFSLSRIHSVWKFKNSLVLDAKQGRKQTYQCCKFSRFLMKLNIFIFSFWMNCQSSVRYLLLPMICLGQNSGS